jgi:hypothetical protein
MITWFSESRQSSGNPITFRWKTWNLANFVASCKQLVGQDCPHRQFVPLGSLISKVVYSLKRTNRVFSANRIILSISEIQQGKQSATRQRSVNAISETKELSDFCFDIVRTGSLEFETFGQPTCSGLRAMGERGDKFIVVKL